MYKVLTTVPLTHVQAVRQAMGDAGAGIAGNYTHCSFSVRGQGRFLPHKGANPFLGKVGEAEVVEEEQIQVTVEDDKLMAVLTAMKAAHPYEEMMFDVYRLENIRLDDIPPK
ncbi:MAG: hypothetical protein GC129_04070 [Proteobacteria bacterium]|nr:hypothetical protein [Pseudomonadota bacterium]